MEWSWKRFFRIILIIGCLFFVIPIKIPVPHQDPHLIFLDFAKKYNKTYLNNETEFQNRFQLFKLSLTRINELNANRTPQSALYGLTEYADMSPEEFKQQRLRYNPNLYNNSVFRRKRSIEQLPENVDWRSKGVVTSVKDQRHCGACWAFSTVENIESMFAIKNKTLRNLSVQQVVDCAENGNFGCNGGDIKSLLEWLTSGHIKLQQESDYPFKERNDVCHYNPSMGIVLVTNFSCKNAVGAEDAVLDEIAKRGPVTVAVNAVDWQYYMGGIIQYNCAGNVEDLNHAAQIVGYVNSAPVPYYILRNSWGTRFGLNGYIHLAAHSNICGLANQNEMRYIAAYLLAGLAGNTQPVARDLEVILSSVGIDIDKVRLNSVVNELKGLRIDEVMAEGMKHLTIVNFGGSPTQKTENETGSDCGQPPTNNEVSGNEDTEQSDDDLGFGLFD